MVDVRIENHDSIVAFQPLTQESEEWLREETSWEPYQWFGGALCVDHRCAEGLAEGLVACGFNIG